MPKHLSYFVQIGDGTGQNWGAAIAVPNCHYAPDGVVTGQKVSFRVAVQRPNGLSTYSDPLVITVR